jgi:hypothetical protein
MDHFQLLFFAVIIGLRGADGDFLGLVLTVKAPLGVNMTPYRLLLTSAAK